MAGRRAAGSTAEVNVARAASRRESAQALGSLSIAGALRVAIHEPMRTSGKLMLIPRVMGSDRMITPRMTATAWLM